MEQVVQVRVVAAEVDVVSGRLWAAGAEAIAEHPGVLDGEVVLVAGGPVEALLSAAGAWEAAVVAVPSGAGLDAWRDHAVPVRAGRRIAVRAPWLPPTSESSDDVEVVVDARRAFGSGSHVSTRLALAAIEDRVPVGGSVVDVGCGSGVLAVAAALLGAARVVAIDVDPEAVTTTRLNAEANGVAELVDASDRPVSQVVGPFDLVVANVLAVTLEALGGELARMAGEAGTLVVSGLLASQADRVLEAIGLDELAREEEDGWVALVLGS